MEKNIKDAATKTDVAPKTDVSAVNEVITEVIEVGGKKLMVQRKLSNYKTQRGEDCYNYRVEGVLRGRTVHVDLDPMDRGGYQMLDIAFFEETELPLTVINNIIKDKDGKKNVITTYEVRSFDESGVLYTATIKPAEKSDKDLLNALLSALAATNALAAATK